ncbi:uncharacterized protein LOC122390880 isoform X2 [Amphibalanus amphitrite]|uniref:uncharacterized protein LOC122390880 isoform X2 n=1 Tax=Amphibalanus amphitrite TaxID=1232801 RepID=UPI001C8FCE2C|nr:uncharacterized protein LOC122390880 isoform X2 [Amphibalanus amphitrite]
MQCCSVGPAVLLTLLLVGDVVTSAAVWKHSCERPNITNGRVVTVRTPRKSATGHMFKYRCRRGYRRLGNMYNICLRGRWVLEHPFCARRGCAALASPAGGSARQSVQGDVTTFQCEPGYRLTGDASLHCNGRQWNGTAPACEGPGSLVWTPAADGGGGAERLFSARLPAAAATSGCVRFWHRPRRRRHPLYSDAVRVFALKADSSAPSGHLRAALRGTDGVTSGDWTETVVPLPTVDEPIEIVIEAGRSAGRGAAVELRDVALMHEDECDAVATPSEGQARGTPTPDLEDEDPPASWPGPLDSSSQDEAPPLPAEVSRAGPHSPPQNTLTPDPAPSVPAARRPVGLTPRRRRPGGVTHRRRLSISPRRGAVTRVRRPGDTASRTESPSVVARPPAISSAAGGAHGAGSAAFPARRRRPLPRGRGVESGLTSPAGGDEISATPHAVGGPVEGAERGGDSRVGQAGDQDGGGGDVASVLPDSRAEGATDEGEPVDYGDTGCNNGNGCRKSGGDFEGDVFGSNGASPAEGDALVETDSEEEIEEEDSDLLMLEEEMQSISTTMDANKVLDRTLEDSDTTPIIFPSEDPRSEGNSGHKNWLGDLPTFLVPPKINPINTINRNDHPTSTASPDFTEKRDETITITLEQMTVTENINTSSENNDQPFDPDRNKSSAILLGTPAGREDEGRGLAAGADLPFYIVVALAAGGCLLILVTVSTVAVSRRRRAAAPAPAAGSVFEPEPGDRGPIAELMRQNRLDHQAVVPAPVSL